MLSTIRKCVEMMPPGMRARWAALVPLTLLLSAAEAGTAAAILALFAVLNDPSQAGQIGWVAWLVQRLPSQRPDAVLLQLIALAAVYHILKTALGLGVHYARTRILHDASARMASSMLRRYLAAPFPFHFHRNSAELIRNCTTSVGQVLGVVVGTLLTSVSELMVAAGLAMVLLSAAPALSVLAGTTLLMLLFVILRMTSRAAGRFGVRAHRLSADMLKTLDQAFGGIKEVKVLGRESFFLNEFEERQQELLVLGYQGITLNHLPSVVMQTVMVVGGLLLIAVIATVSDAARILPTVGVFGYAALRLMPSANWALQSFNAVRSARAAVDELYEDYQTLATARDDVGSGAAALEFREAIELDRVSYVYPGADRRALENVSLRVKRGECIGVVGPTGAGKSTMVDIVLGLLSPTEGRVMVDHHDLSASSSPWRRRVGYVPQAIFLIDDTLRRNIALGIAVADIDDGRVREAAELAQLGDLVARLPAGFDTSVGERGIRLSGGERQRIAIARALYHDPDLLVFDEATSALDLATEAEIARTIARLRGAKTMLVVAHRLSTVKACDRLVYLREGAVAGVGTFDELRSRNEDFRKLAALATL